MRADGRDPKPVDADRAVGRHESHLRRVCDVPVLPARRCGDRPPTRSPPRHPIVQPVTKQTASRRRARLAARHPGCPGRRS
jgi:hypothetical protein